MRINSKILSVPPYISTSWKNIASLHVESRESFILIITLLNGTQIEIPELDQTAIEIAFAAHAKYLEEESIAPATKSIAPTNFPMSNIEQNSNTEQMSVNDQVIRLGLPFKGGINLGEMKAVTQHNPEQSDTPDLPASIIEKIAALTRTLGVDEPNLVPKPEPHCNCLHCQIARAIHKGMNDEEASVVEVEKEEEVSDSDLTFRDWDIKQTNEQLYVVTNPLDAKEHYSVYLGNPIGCTCGEKHCEHIRTVLNS